jgi:hypothetical protein
LADAGAIPASSTKRESDITLGSFLFDVAIGLSSYCWLCNFGLVFMLGLRVSKHIGISAMQNNSELSHASNQSSHRSNQAPYIGAAIAIIVILVVGLILVSHFLFKPTATFQAHVTRITVQSSGSVVVSYTVSNSGKASGSPLCTINATGSKPAYVGVDEFLVPTSLAPGSALNSIAQISVSDSGARFITEASISCS